MGVDSTFACRDCKEKAYLGYGSALSWLDRCKTLAEYDAQYEGKRSIPRNKRFRWMLERHEGHDWETFSTDYYRVQKGDLVFEDPCPWATSDGELFIAGYANFEKVMPEPVDEESAE